MYVITYGLAGFMNSFMTQSSESTPTLFSANAWLASASCISFLKSMAPSITWRSTRGQTALISAYCSPQNGVMAKRHEENSISSRNKRKEEKTKIKYQIPSICTVARTFILQSIIHLPSRSRLVPRMLGDGSGNETRLFGIAKMGAASLHHQQFWKGNSLHGYYAITCARVWHGWVSGCEHWQQFSSAPRPPPKFTERARPVTGPGKIGPESQPLFLSWKGLRPETKAPSWACWPSGDSQAPMLHAWTSLLVWLATPFPPKKGRILGVASQINCLHATCMLVRLWTWPCC